MIRPALERTRRTVRQVLQNGLALAGCFDRQQVGVFFLEIPDFLETDHLDEVVEGVERVSTGRSLD